MMSDNALQHKIEFQIAFTQQSTLIFDLPPTYTFHLLLSVQRQLSTTLGPVKKYLDALTYPKEPTMLHCVMCKANRAQVIRPKNGMKICKNCFLEVFELEIHTTIIENKIFSVGERIAVGASGGKDSTVLAAVLKTLNERYRYGVEFVLLSIDEGIHGYRDDSLETVKRNAVQYGMELSIVGYEALYGWTMDQVVQKIGKRSNCTYCGVFRRQALDRAAQKLGISHILTGHNADDVAETVIMNFLRGDLPRLGRCAEIVTASPTSTMKRSKPLKYAYEKEIVLYAHYRSLDYFSTECIYSPEAFRGNARALLKGLEKIRPSSILDIVRSGEQLAQLPGVKIQELNLDFVQTLDKQPQGLFCGKNDSKSGAESNMPRTDQTQALRPILTSQRRPRAAQQEEDTSDMVEYSPKTLRGKRRVQQIGACERCGYMSSQPICKACVLIGNLNRGTPSIGVAISEKKEAYIA